MIFFNISASKDSELLWLENPPSHSYTSPWKQHVITHGPDVYLRNVSLSTPDGVFDVIVTTEFFTKKLSIHWTTDTQNRWTDPSKVHLIYKENPILNTLSLTLFFVFNVKCKGQCESYASWDTNSLSFMRVLITNVNVQKCKFSDSLV